MSPQLPLYAQIQNFLREGIAQGRYAHGERLPSEPELAQRFSTTRATVARALQQLVFEGLISRRVGSGTFVGGSRLEDSVDTSLFETFGDHVQAAGGTLEYRLLAFRRARAGAAAARELGLPADAPVFRMERLRSVNSAVVGMEIRFVPEAIGSRIDKDWLDTLSIQQILRGRLSLRVGRIDNAVSATVANPRVAGLLGIAEGKPLLVRAYTLYTPRARPLMHGHTLYRSDFRIRYTLRSGE